MKIGQFVIVPEDPISRPPGKIYQTSDAAIEAAIETVVALRGGKWLVLQVVAVAELADSQVVSSVHKKTCPVCGQQGEGFPGGDFGKDLL